MTTKNAGGHNQYTRREVIAQNGQNQKIQLKPLQKNITLGATPLNALKNLSKASMPLRRSRMAKKQGL